MSGLLAQQRLIGQVNSDQLDLFRLQTQVSTGRRVITPSDDAPAALRAMNLQRILERKAQAQNSLQNSVLYLGAAENSISQVTNTLNDIRAAALGVADSISTPEQRQAVIDQVNRAIESLVTIGNTKFRERYLFSGSQSQTAPYAHHGDSVEYLGNEGALRSFVDVDFLLSTNLPGSEVFGGLSEKVRGSVDLDPQVTRGTRLSDLNGGAGISSGGAVELVYVNSTGTATTSVVDLSRASTIGDVARYLQNGVPEGSNIRVEVTSSGLTLTTASGAEGVFVREVAEGRTARELGIYSTTAQSVLVGQDISPQISNTTRLDDLLGRKATAAIESVGSNNDLLIRATRNGADLNGVTVQFVSGVTAGSESAVYDDVAGTLTIAIEPGVTTAAHVAHAINNEATGTFYAEIDRRDATSPIHAGTDVVELGATAVLEGGAGETLDLSSGLAITNGGETTIVDVSSAQTVEQLLNILNKAELGLQAEINAQGNGINIRSRLSGADLTIGEVAGGTTATQLGVRTLTESTRLDQFNRGQGIIVDGVNDLTIELTTLDVTTTYNIDLSGAVRVEDAMSAIATQTAGAVTVELAADGNGLVLTDTTTADSLRVTGQVAKQLGFFGGDDTEVVGVGSLTADDRHTIETDSIFNSLIRLRTSLEQGDIPAIGKAIERIDEDLDRINFARSEIGARLQSLDTLSIRHDDEQVTLKASLSQEIDVDMAEAISQFMARQYSLQASLQTSANILRMSILDFL